MGGVESAQVRKSVTVLFTDVVGSTPLGSALDPEAARTVMARFFEAVRSPIERHGGVVEKYIGDAVMAVFGFPVVHEDDPLRACRAAIEVEEQLALLNAELGRDFGVSIAIRTGISSGEVVAGQPDRDQVLVTGDPVVTAARLQQVAEPGAILVGEATFSLVGDQLDVEPIAPVKAKGKPEPLVAFRLIAVTPEIGERPIRMASPLVGREREFRSLSDAFEECMRSEACTLTTIIGDPGIGKSRLVREVAAAIGDRATVLKGRCLPYGDGITFWPILEVVGQAAGISDAMSADEAVARIEELLPATEARSAMRDRVAAAVGLRESVGGLHETFWAIRQLLEEQARRRPLVVVFEDVHWAEPAFLDLVEYLGERTEGPVLLVCLTRPELFGDRPDWAEGSPRQTTVVVEPLGRAENDRLVRNLLGGEAPRSIAGRVAETAEGNPLFIEEMVGMLLDEERLVARGDGWTSVEDGSELEMPRSVKSVLSARIERLPEEQRAVLQRASVVGRVFWWGAVADLSPAEEQPRVGVHLRAMVRGGLIEPDETTFAGQDAFKFRHILIRDAAYGSLPRSLRSALHERFAGWLERAAGNRAEEYEEILGYHLEQASTLRLTSGREGEPDVAVRAVGHLTSAARRAFDRDDIGAALNLASRASRLCPVEDPRRNEIDLILADSLVEAAEHGRADDVLAELEQRAKKLDDRRTEWLAKIKRAVALQTSANTPFEDIKPTYDRALAVFTELSDEDGLAEAWTLLAWVRFNTGRAREATGASTQAAMHAQAAGDAAKEIWASVNSVYYAAFGDMPVPDALDLCRSLLERVRGQPGFEANLSDILGLLEGMLGNFEIARAAIERAREITRDLGASHQLAGMTATAAFLARFEGDVAREEQELRDGYEEFRRIGARAFQATWAAMLARNLVGQSHDEEALELTVESEELGAPDDVSAQVPWREARSIVLARRGEAEEAERLARDGVEIADRTDFLNTRGEAHTSLAEVLALCGRLDQAADEYGTAQALFEQKGNLVALGTVRDALERLRHVARS